MNVQESGPQIPGLRKIPSEFRLILMPFCNEESMISQLVSWGIPRAAISTENGLRFHSKPDVNLIEEHKGSFFFSEAGIKLLKEVREGGLKLTEKPETNSEDVEHTREEIISFIEKIQRKA